MKIFTLLALLVLTFNLSAQEKFQVKDFATQESIPFVKVITEGKPAVHADLDGHFSLDLAGISTFQLKFMGYRDTTIDVASLGATREIFMTADAFMFDEVKVVPGENPAHRIIDQVIANRKKN